MRSRPLALLGFVLLCSCNNLVVRDANTYHSEMSWFSVSFEQSAEALATAAADALAAGDRDKCLEYAELALTIGVRGPYHTDMSLYLVELGGDPGEVPEIPSAETLCPELPIEAPEPVEEG